MAGYARRHFCCSLFSFVARSKLPADCSLELGPDSKCLAYGTAACFHITAGGLVRSRSSRSQRLHGRFLTSMSRSFLHILRRGPTRLGTSAAQCAFLRESQINVSASAHIMHLKEAGTSHVVLRVERDSVLTILTHCSMGPGTPHPLHPLRAKSKFLHSSANCDMPRYAHCTSIPAWEVR